MIKYWRGKHVIITREDLMKAYNKSKNSKSSISIGM